MAAPTIDHRGPGFARLARELDVDLAAGDWRSGVRPELVFERLSADAGHVIKAVTVVHNETSTGTESSITQIRAAIDAAAHPALLLCGRYFITRIH